MRSRIGVASFLLCLAVLVGSAAAAPHSTCYIAKGKNAGTQPTDWSAIVVLDSLETTAKITINCCACGGLGGTGVRAFLNTDAEGQVLALNGIAGGACPITATWKSTDSTPLTPARVQALKNGTMYVWAFKQVCSDSPAGPKHYLVPGPCDQ
ncbi:MAG TPA: hypothetical protein VJS69_11350 [Candidatus Krumholzibacteria bacterium]|nr:hypothetical protein [Candidatus Krumholzibacteria bacterium]